MQRIPYKAKRISKMILSSEVEEYHHQRLSVSRETTAITSLVSVANKSDSSNLSVKKSKSTAPHVKTEHVRDNKKKSSTRVTASRPRRQKQKPHCAGLHRSGSEGQIRARRQLQQQSPSGGCLRRSKSLEGNLHQWSQTKKIKKRVRFHGTPDGSIIELHVAAKAGHQHALPLSKTDVANRWWTKQEGLALRRQAGAMVDAFKECRPSYHRAGMDLLAAATLSNGNPDHVAADPSEIQKVVDCSARGLEKYILPILRRKQNHSVRALLSLQERLSKKFNNNNRDGKDKEEEMTQILALSYERSTQYAAMWALVLGTGDALAAEQADAPQDETARGIYLDAYYKQLYQASRAAME